jgi:hypothetical protein
MPRLGALGTGRALKGPKLRNKKKPAKKTTPGPKFLGIDNGQSAGKVGLEPRLLQLQVQNLQVMSRAAVEEVILE